MVICLRAISHTKSERIRLIARILTLRLQSGRAQQSALLYRALRILKEREKIIGGLLRDILKRNIA